MSKQDMELKELALHFFKMGNVSAEESYEHALSFLSINLDNRGRNIVDKIIKYNNKRIGGYLCWSFLFEDKRYNVRVIGVSSNDEGESDALSDYIEKTILKGYNNETTVIGEWKIEKDSGIVVTDDNIYSIAVY